MDTYNVGIGPQQINLTVDISTNGLAASRAIAGKPGIGNSPVAHSVDATGDIPKTAIGTASSLNGMRLSIMTKIDLSAIRDKDTRKKESENTNASFILDNGTDGQKVFTLKDEDKTSSDDFNNVVIYKEISLT
jgi:hypothetical protein